MRSKCLLTNLSAVHHRNDVRESTVTKRANLLLHSPQVMTRTLSHVDAAMLRHSYSTVDNRTKLRMEFGNEQILLVNCDDVWFAAPERARWIDLQTLSGEPALAASVLKQQGYEIGLDEIETFLAKATRGSASLKSKPKSESPPFGLRHSKMQYPIQ